jgi:hypothetical protein
LGASVGASVRASVRASLGDSLGASVGDSVGAWYWADDMSFADVFVDTNVLSKEKAQKLEEYKQLLSTQRIAVLNKDIAYVLVAPTIHRNTLGQLHNDKGRSVDWGKSGLYHLNGVTFTKELWESITSRTITFADVLKIEDIDQRKQAMKYCNVWDFVQYAKGKEVDTYTKIGKDGRKIRYWLYKFSAGEIFDRGVTYAIYDDSMVGEAEQHMQGVPNECNTVAEAMAWKQSDDSFTLSPAEWEALELDVHFT